MNVGTHVLVLVGMWAGCETVVTEIIEGDPEQYDVACAPGRYYFDFELTIVVEAVQS